MILHGTSDGTLVLFSDITSYPSLVQTSPGTLLFNQWMHVCITITSTRLTTIYSNAVSIYSGTPVPNAFANPNKTHCVLGTTYYGNTGLVGYIDDFRIYNKALLSSEVVALYNNPNYSTTSTTITTTTNSTNNYQLYNKITSANIYQKPINIIFTAIPKILIH